MALLSSMIASAPHPVEQVVALGRAICERLPAVPHGELSPALIRFESGSTTILPADGDRNRYGPYAAPERTMNRPVTSAADVYSVAVIMYELLTARLPFAGASPMEVMLASVKDAPIEVRSLRPEVPFSLATVLGSAMLKDPAQRLQSGSELQMALATLEAPRADLFPGKRLLIADDDSTIRDLFAMLATRMGITFDVVANGREAIDAMKARRYTVALLDLNMPRMDGWAVIDYLRRKPNDKPTHVFVITGFTNQHVTGVENDVVEAILYKPIDADSLRALLTKALL